MAYGTSVQIDILTLGVSVIAVLYFWMVLSKISKGAIWTAHFWAAIGVSMISLRKIFDFVGEYYFDNAMVWNRLEDLSFLLGLFALMYSAKLTFDFFQSLSYKLDRFRKRSV